MSSATTLAVWTKAICSALEKQGIDPVPLLDECGIDIRLTEDPDARLPITTTSALMSAATKAAGDPAFCLKVGLCTRPTTWHALGYAIWASKTLREGFQRLATYSGIFSTSGTASLREEDGIFIAEVDLLSDCSELIVHDQVDAVLSTIVLTCRHLAPELFRLERVELTRPEPADTSAFDRMFKCPITYGAAKEALHIPLDIIDAPLPTANSALALVNDKVCEDYLVRMELADFSTRVRHYLIENLALEEPQIEQAAQALNISTRSLQRKLTAQNTSFKELLENVRQELAMKQIKQAHLSISEISYSLGFAHMSNFSRAFKRWTGMGPTEYRKQLFGSEAP